MNSYSEYWEALGVAGPKMKELILDRAADDPDHDLGHPGGPGAGVTENLLEERK